ncbi:hypothetical protein [Marinomonas algarum]|uniref:Chromosome partition protein Smc n=1 Tax=Marinomonas algarum TaxID=2883105 RepID=A0A9X1IMX8_9GAMM|nr:hypothetical protein [Marinomonas algarum]MCB5161882.1 hypothetical protein [Marinomonas algarum]
MNVCKRMVIPITFGLALSACSTTSQQQTDAMLTGANEVSTAVQTSGQENPTAESSPSPSINNTAKLEQDIQAKNRQIDSLQQQLSKNQQRLVELNKALNQKDTLIASLQKERDQSAEALADLEAQKMQRALLESRYAALNLENDQLKNDISHLKNENQVLKQRITALESLPKSQGDYPMRYLSLLSDNTQLQQAYADLELANEANQQQLASLKKENLILGGALSDSRAQQQVLWDRIQAFEVAKDITDVLSDKAKAADAEPEERRDNTDRKNADQKSIPLDQGSTIAAYELENQRLRAELTQLQGRIARQEQALSDYQIDIVRLEAALDENANYEARWKALDNKLIQAQKDNAALSIRLNTAQEALRLRQAELSAMTDQLSRTQQSLELNENRSISIEAAIASLQSQTNASLQNIQWQLPSEMGLYDTFEILVSAEVTPSLSGQAYQAELVTDSDIQMISDRVASAVVQNGRVQWRWRVSGLNEKPDAQLNVFVTQQMNFQDQVIQRQVYRGAKTLSLVNTNLLEKYGYWGMAILFGLLGGFLIGRTNKSRKNL